MEYGVHSTRYTRLSDEQLYSMYRETAYSQLKEEEKLELIQETVNRDAMERGEIGSPEVRFIDLPVNESGNSIDGVININRDMAVYGVQNYEYKGHVIHHNIDDYNIQTLNTAIHENIHCFQAQIIDGTIDTDDMKMRSEYQAKRSWDNMDIIVWISRIATCILFVVVIFLMAHGERISTAVLDVALLLGIITIFIGGIRHDRK